MKTPLIAALLFVASVPAAGQFRTLNDRFAPPAAASAAEWTARAAALRQHVLASAGLLPLPARAPLKAHIFDERAPAGYRVAKVYFESLPGFFVTGNLYRPDGEGPFPAVLSTHGHWTYGRLEHNEVMSGPGRAITLARLGFVVFAYDMVGYNDSRQLTHAFDGKRERLWGLSLAGLQLWNSIRSLDFLESLSYVRKDAIGITGESGGGTQTYMLAAADDRVAAAVPVNMISFHMQGGCLCENPPGLRLETTNVEIAATIAPRPMLMISATGDWTKDTLEAEFPAVRRLYGFAGAGERVQAVRFTAPHNYNRDSREAMYAWMARWLKGAPAEPRIEERSFSPDPLPDLLVFHQRPLPDGAVTPETLVSHWIEGARVQLAATPLSVRAAALRHALGFHADGTQPAAIVPARRRPTALVAGDTRQLEPALSKAGFAIHRVGVTPFDTDAAAAVRHFETYNRTRASQLVADLVTALRANPGAALVAVGDEALAGVLASAIAPPAVALLDVKGFDTGRDGDYLTRLYIPGLRRAGDLRTASEMAAGRLNIFGAGAAFAAPGANVRQGSLGSAEVAALLHAARTR